MHVVTCDKDNCICMLWLITDLESLLQYPQYYIAAIDLIKCFQKYVLRTLEIFLQVVA